MTGAGKRVAIIQSNYIPWKGYFDVIASVDEFILLDEVQYTRRDWRNRNVIKPVSGKQWLTLPVQVKGKYTQRIDETLVADPAWADKHWRTIAQAYAKAPHVGVWRDAVQELYATAPTERLSDVNRHFIEGLCALLGIVTPITWSTDYDAGAGKNERLIDLCRAAGATTYLSGPAAQDYMDVSTWAEHGIAVEWIDYSGYPEYPQLSEEPFTHGVTVLDLLFNVGEDAPSHLKSLRKAVTT